MIVDSEGQLFVLTKVKKGESELYAFGAFEASATKKGKRVGVYAVEDDRKKGTRTTSAALSPNGKWLAVRTYHRVYVFDASSGVQTALSRTPCVFEPVEEPQGEAIAWASDESLLLTSEGVGEPLWRIPFVVR